MRVSLQSVFKYLYVLLWIWWRKCSWYLTLWRYSRKRQKKYMYVMSGIPGMTVSKIFWPCYFLTNMQTCKYYLPNMLNEFDMCTCMFCCWSKSYGLFEWNSLNKCLNFFWKCILYKSCLFVAEEARAKYGADKIKIYNSTFTPMYYAVTSRKEKCSMKLICALPEEKVGHLNQIKFVK